jgi:hypothetical protein
MNRRSGAVTSPVVPDTANDRADDGGRRELLAAVRELRQAAGRAFAEPTTPSWSSESSSRWK